MARKKARKIKNFRGRYGFLSNFHKLHPITTEHVFQAMKTTDWHEQVEILMAATPGEAKALGRRCTLRPDWERIKLDVMEYVNRQKFSMTAGLTQSLIATEDATLIEGNTHGDRFWGKVDDEGENWFGRILMRIRSDRAELWRR